VPLLVSVLLTVHQAGIGLAAQKSANAVRVYRIRCERKAMSEIYAQTSNAQHGDGTIHIHPPLLAASLFLIGLVLHLAGRHHQSPFPFHQFLGLLLATLGTGFSCFAAALFAAHGTTKNPYGEPAAFVTVAPYTFTRNPMYVGMTMILFGFATFFGSLVMLLAPIAFAAVVDRMVIPQEEAAMERLYGQEYRDYKSRVARWLPIPSFPR
jgi:protein-S-isoprenylcysteine O-methyltransferase Ste14